MEITVNRLVLLSMLSFILIGCNSDDLPPAEVTPVPPVVEVPPVEPPVVEVPPVEPPVVEVPPVVPGEPVYFDVDFPIDSVDYSAVSVDESNLTSGARQLAAQCAQCHGTYGVAVAGWPDLWGSGRSIGKWMKDYQNIEDYIDNVMHMHAIAYTDEEVQLIKEYYENVTYTGGL